MGYPQSRIEEHWNPLQTMTGWGTHPGQVVLGQVMVQVVCLLQFPTGGLSCLYTIWLHETFCVNLVHGSVSLLIIMELESPHCFVNDQIDQVKTFALIL